jgi:hypothetical protein
VQALKDRGALNAQHDVASPAVFHGNASDTDIIVASVKAYLKALTRMLVALGQAPFRPRAASVPPPPVPQPAPAASSAGE